MRLYGEAPPSLGMHIRRLVTRSAFAIPWLSCGSFQCLPLSSSMCHQPPSRVPLLSFLCHGLQPFLPKGSLSPADELPPPRPNPQHRHHWGLLHQRRVLHQQEGEGLLPGAPSLPAQRRRPQRPRERPRAQLLQHHPRGPPAKDLRAGRKYGCFFPTIFISAPLLPCPRSPALVPPLRFTARHSPLPHPPTNRSGLHSTTPTMSSPPLPKGTRCTLAPPVPWSFMCLSVRCGPCRLPQKLPGPPPA